jgi:coenzyme F420-reducing hydrogenase beta subunit
MHFALRPKTDCMKENMCSECNACIQICTHQAIQLKVNQEGFAYPEIDSEKCINCNLCNKVCPMQNGDKTKSVNIKTLAVQTLDNKTLQKSSSGGVFSLIALYVLDQGGIVYGAAWDSNMQLHHIGAETEKDLEKLRGSKYVHSDIGNSFREIKEHLKQGRIVYFTGTPCQVSALKLFLRKPYDNLITSDLICHGTPSQKLFNAFLENMEKELEEKIIDYKFRDKKIAGWSCSSSALSVKKGGKRKYHIYDKNMRAYYLAFIKGDITREDCYQCPFTTVERTGDITLADFWDIHKYHPTFPNLPDGVSLILINSNKGNNIWEQVKSKTHYQLSSLNIAVQTCNKNLYTPTTRPPERDTSYRNAFEDIVKFRDSYLNNENPRKIYLSYYKRKIRNNTLIAWIWKRTNH